MIAEPGDIITLSVGIHREPWRFQVLGPISNDLFRRQKQLERIRAYRELKAKRKKT